MNRKSKRNLIVLLILIVVLLVIFLFLKKNEDADFMQEETGTTEESVPVVSINKEEVTDMEFIRSDGGSFTLHKQEDTWNYLEEAAIDTSEDSAGKITEAAAEDTAGDTARDITEGADEDTTEATTGDITEAAAEDDTEDTTEDTAQGADGENAETIRQVNQDTVSAYLDDICAFTAKQEITNVTDYSDYGISDESDTVTLQLANDLYVFRIGDYNSLAGGYYLTVNDGSSVYLIDSSTYYLLHKDSSYFEAVDEEESTEAADQE